MSEEENIHDNPDLFNSEEEVTSTEPKTEPVAGPELEPEPEVEIISSVTERSGVEEEAADEALREQIHPPDVVQPKLIPQRKPKKETMSTSLMKIQRSLAVVSKLIEKQTTQINKINQTLQPLQKQMRVWEKQTEIVNQIRSQVNQIQKQVSQVQKIIQKRSSAISQKSSKKRSKSKSNK
jgi:predicted transcriptional regulator